MFQKPSILKTLIWFHLSIIHRDFYYLKMLTFLPTGSRDLSVYQLKHIKKGKQRKSNATHLPESFTGALKYCTKI